MVTQRLPATGRGTEQMRAAVMFGGRDVRVETVPDARLIEPTDVPARAATLGLVPRS